MAWSTKEQRSKLFVNSASERKRMAWSTKVLHVVIITLLVRTIGGTSCDEEKCWTHTGSCAEAPETCMVSCNWDLRNPVTNACRCNGTMPTHKRRGGKAAVYAGSWLAPVAVGRRTTWDEVDGALERASFLAFEKAEAVFRSGHDEGFWLHHVSAYEHSLMSRHPRETAMEKVRETVQAELDAMLSDDVVVEASFKDKTIAVIPFYGGALNKDTGNAHSTQPLDLKLLVLWTNVVALLRGFAGRVVVATCSSTDDRARVDEFFQKRPHRDGMVTVYDAPCTLTKRLPFHGLAGLFTDPDFPFGGAKNFDYVIYNEADNIFHWADQQTADLVASFLRAFPRTLITPHRRHKRYGANPACGSACGLMTTGQNLCRATTPNVQLAVVETSRKLVVENAK